MVVCVRKHASQVPTAFWRVGKFLCSTRVLCVSDLSRHPRVHLPHLSLHLPRLRPYLPCPCSAFPCPAGMSASGGSWVCLECGKVCKSCGGLTQHSAIHKCHPHMRELDDNSTHIYHPSLDGMFNFSFCYIDSNWFHLPKENHANRMESFFPLAPHLFSHGLSPMTIGLHLNHAPDLNLQRYYIAKPPSQTVPLTNSSASGVLR